MTLAELLHNCGAIFPELILALTICAVILSDMLTPLNRSRLVCGSLSILGAIAAIASLGYQPDQSASAQALFFDGTLVHDRLGVIFKLIFLTGMALTMLFSLRSKELAGYRFGEYFSLLLGATFGACLLVSSNNLVVFFLALETLSMCSYILAGFIKHERPPAEAALKYMLYGAVTSGVMLFGLSYLYGLTGTLEINECMRMIAHSAHHSGRPLVILLTLTLVLTGLGFKIAMVPFHFWCPDVYQGSPTPITAFLSVVSKAAGFSALLRLGAPVIQFHEFAAFVSTDEQLAGVNIVFGLFAAATMTYGNLVAIRQNDVKRLLAYSSIAQAGYLLLGMAVFRAEAVEAMLIYLIIYLIMNLGAFWVIILLIDHLGGAEISRFRGAAFHSPVLVTVMFICLVSLTGLPPTAGFVAKFMLFKVVIGAGIDSMNHGLLTAPATFYFTLAVLGVLNSAVSLYYYMKIIKVMVFEPAPEQMVLRVEWVDRLYAIVLAAPLILLLQFGPLVELVRGVLQPSSSVLVSWLL